MESQSDIDEEARLAFAATAPKPKSEWVVRGRDRQHQAAVIRVIAVDEDEAGEIALTRHGVVATNISKAPPGSSVMEQSIASDVFVDVKELHFKLKRANLVLWILGLISICVGALHPIVNLTIAVANEVGAKFTLVLFVGGLLSMLWYVMCGLVLMGLGAALEMLGKIGLMQARQTRALKD